MKKLISLFVALSLAGFGGLAEAGESLPILYAYGPAGPGPAMKEAAATFGAADHVKVVVVAGPPPMWLAKARWDADMIFSGAEATMSNFAQALPGAFDLGAAEPLYLRPAAILVRPGNPKAIHGFRDLLKPGVKVLTTEASSQIGLWEDVAGRTGDIALVRAFRRNMVLPEPSNSVAALKQWTEQADIDAWLIWNIWQVANPKVAETVPLEEPYRIYRDTGVVLTHKGAADPKAKAFVDFLKSDQGRAIFVKWGWEEH
ncbi:substrate-binding domain-containing protein [Rhodoblastus sp.]|jgi:accessory colonization factor AcfC|uniref:substrate-binding domain-containing protein n=1 Tax=Rhodoblastus sp. TaxID=1962975 RepID=UPI002605EEE2|nr:substrate-binding domain-containing protein [Rhodoblastus sp.]